MAFEIEDIGGLIIVICGSIVALSLLGELFFHKSDAIKWDCVVEYDYRLIVNTRVQLVKSWDGFIS